MASGPLAGPTLLWGIKSDHWPYNSLRDLMGTFDSAHFKSVHLGPCPSALGATLISLPIFSCLRNGSFEHCHQLANSYISRSLFLPTSGRSWLYSELPGQVDFETFEQWFSWQWPSPTILKKRNCGVGTLLNQWQLTRWKIRDKNLTVEQGCSQGATDLQQDSGYSVYL